MHYQPEPSTILVIDDNPMNLEVLYTALSEQGYKIRIEMDGEHAIEQIIQDPPNLILLDIMLPDINGFEVCQRLKELPIIADIPIIFMTALADASDKVKGLQLGAVDYITKPFHKEEVLARISLHLQLQQLNRSLEHQNLKLKNFTEELEDRVEERTIQLIDSIEKLKVQDRAIAASKNGIVISDARQENCPILFVNPAFEAITGYSKDSVIGKNCRFLQGDDTNQPGVKALKTALKEGKHCHVCIRNYRQDGTLFWNELSVSPIYEEGTLTHFVGIQTDVTARKNSENDLQQSLQDKELLLKEIHHRVKNNLLIVSSLLDLQTDYIEDEALIEYFEDSQNRIQSMALIHEKLYRSSDLGEIQLDEYLESLVSQLIYSFDIDEDRICVHYDLHPLSVNIETATPCGLIISELIANTFKHAFPDGKTGEIHIILRPIENNQIHIQLKDTGMGFPEDFDITTHDSLGMKLVTLLTKQLRGALNIVPGDGSTIDLKFQELNYRKRI